MALKPVQTLCLVPFNNFTSNSTQLKLNKANTMNDKNIEKQKALKKLKVNAKKHLVKKEYLKKQSSKELRKAYFDN